MKKYRFTFVLGLENALEYRFDFFLSLVSTLFPIVIQTYLWTAIYQSPEATVNNGYTYPQMILYTLLAGMVSKLVSTGFEYEVNTDIKNGGLNKFIIRPISYLRYRFCSFLGGKLPAAAILAVVCALTLTAASLLLHVSIEPVRVVLFLVSLALALALNFALFFSISMLGFWFTEISKLFGTISIVLVVVSGGVFPLDIFGDAVTKLTSLLPFKYTTQFPVDILNGKLPFPDAFTGFCCQIFWLCALLALSSLLWRRGLRRYIAAGG